MSRTLEEKIRKRTARIAVVGLGYVGLPLAVSFAKAGYQVVGLDTDDDRIQRVNDKISYILDVPEKVLAAVIDKGRFSAQKDFSIISKMDVVIICVPTPLKRRYTPDISYMVQSVRTISKYLKRDTLVVLESTTYPGTTEDLIKPALEKKGRKLGRDFYLSFSPERIDPGNKNYDLTRIPKLVGGLNKKSGELTRQLYQKIIRKVIVVSSAKTAEMAKLLENTFRIINIGFINEVAIMCHKMGINVWEVIDAAKSKPFGFMPFYPGLGVGGHCIPDDPLYLFWKARRDGHSSKFIKLSADINHAMPRYAVDCLAEVLSKRKIKLKAAKILILGVTYKKDVHDLRKSPVLTLIELLQEKEVQVDYYDPMIPRYLKFGKIDLKGIAFSGNNLRKYDCVVLAVDHTALDYETILNESKLIYDVRNKFHGVENNKIIRF